MSQTHWCTSWTLGFTCTHTETRNMHSYSYVISLASRRNRIKKRLSRSVVVSEQISQGGGVSSGNLNLDPVITGRLLNPSASIPIIVLVNVNIWHLPGDVQSILSISHFMEYKIYDLLKLGDAKCISSRWRKFYHTRPRFSLRLLAMTPRHAAATLLEVFMTCLRLVA